MLKVVGLFTLVLLSSVVLGDRVNVNVYYEALCPDSQAFITTQLYPTLKGPLNNFVELKLIPFGKSNYSTQGSDVKFTCHHGPNECYANKVQACAISNIQSNSYEIQSRETLTIDYINCLMKMSNNFADSLYPGKRCAQEVGLKNWDIIENCANSTEGSKLLQLNGELTNALTPPLTSVPTITFRYQYDHDSQMLALSNFPSALCKKLSQPLPIECTRLPNSATGINGVIASVLIGLIITMLRMA